MHEFYNSRAHAQKQKLLTIQIDNNIEHGNKNIRSIYDCNTRQQNNHK